MKKIIIIILMLGLALSGCSDREQDIQENISTEVLYYDEDVLSQTFSDWVLGTEYGIEEVKVDNDNKNIEIIIPEDKYSQLQDYDIEDIGQGIKDILSFYDLEGAFGIVFSNGETLDADVENTAEPTGEDEEEQPNDNNDSLPDRANGETVNLIFIHHSVGENWLNAGLNQMLNDNNIHVADTYYGWKEMGDRTDTWDWPDWFNDAVMPTVYNEMGNMTGYNDIEPAEGENTIIMFKSCYPNSDVGNSIEDEKEVYLSLLDYFASHPDKMFVLITPPPMQSISHPEKTRELANWLVSADGWRKDYTENNLYVFDFYNVLTAKDNHHMLADGSEQHIINDKSNTLFYDSWGDDHPNDEGSLKAAEEFVPLLIYWYDNFCD